MKPSRDEKGYLALGVKEFLLDQNSLGIIKLKNFEIF